MSRAGSPHRPLRTCVGCRQVDERQNLVRHVLVGTVVTRDERAVLPGRGAWLHDDEACRAKAARRGAFAKAFRRR